MRSDRFAFIAAAGWCVIASFACGGGSNGSSEGSPSGPSRPQLPAASIQFDGNGQTGACVRGEVNIRCQFEETGKNVGSGCATRVRGTVRFINAAQETVLTAGWNLPAARVLAPQEQFSYVMTFSGTIDAVSGLAGYRQEPLWTNTAC